jgi:hypothetical protein
MLARIPALSAVQFGALRMGALEALESQRKPEILAVTPKLILRAGKHRRRKVAAKCHLRLDLQSFCPAWPLSIPPGTPTLGGDAPGVRRDQGRRNRHIRQGLCGL